MGQKVKVLAGDFAKRDGDIGWGRITLFTPESAWYSGENIPLDELATVEVATEESVKRAGGTIGWGAAGAVLLGPVGLLAGLLLGGRGKDITFVAVFSDGRRLLAMTNTKGYQELLAATAIRQNVSADLTERGPCPRCGESIPLAAVVCRFCGLDLEKYDDELLAVPEDHDAADQS